MSDDFEFDDNDDLLLNAICTPPIEDSPPEKRVINRDISTSHPFKRTKSDVNQHSPLNAESIITVSDTRLKRESSVLSPIKRIFPGPAGILLDGYQQSSSSQMDTCSQSTASIFQDGPWQAMSKDFRISSSLQLYDKFNIAWIKREASTNSFINQKAPFLAGVLQSLEVSDGQTKKSVNIALKDMTGFFDIKRVACCLEKDKVVVVVQKLQKFLLETSFEQTSIIRGQQLTIVCRTLLMSQYMIFYEKGAFCMASKAYITLPDDINTLANDVKVKKSVFIQSILGQIQGTILQSLYEEYASYFTLGSVLILVQFGVLSCTCDKCDNHHLTITSKNLSAIYCLNRKIIIKKVDSDEVLKEYFTRKKVEASKISKKNNSPNSGRVDCVNLNKSLGAAKDNCNKNGLLSNFKDNNSPNRNGLVTLAPMKKFTFKEAISQETKAGNSLRILTENCNQQNSDGKDDAQFITTAKLGSNKFVFKQVVSSKKSDVHLPLQEKHNYLNRSYNNIQNLNKTPNISPMDVLNVAKNSLNHSDKFSSITSKNTSNLPQERLSSLHNSSDNCISNTIKDCNIVTTSGCQISVQVENKEHEQIWKDLLEDVDINSLFEEF